MKRQKSLQHRPGRLCRTALLACIALASALCSCDDGDGYSVGDFTPPLWATVRTNSGVFYLESDLWGTLWPVNTDLGWYEPADGQRVIAVFSPLMDNYAGYDHAVKILSMREVLTKNVEVMTADNEAEYGDDPLLVLKGDVGIGGGYLNLCFYQILPADNTKHRISLVRPAADDAFLDAEGYLCLQLRYNTYGSLSGRRSPVPSIVSFSLQGLDVPDGARGIRLALNSEVNGPVELKFDFATPADVSLPDTFGEDGADNSLLR